MIHSYRLNIIKLGYTVHFKMNILPEKSIYFPFLLS
jgi:hypothetical protein